MGCFRTLFGLTLVLRAIFHVLIGGIAAMDLKDLHDATSGTLKQLALKLTHINDIVVEVQIPLVFYVLCGVMLLILSFIFPWRNSHRSRLSAYAVFHLAYMAMVVYVMYVRTIILDLSYIRDVYQVMATPWLFPASLVLDVLTIISAVTATGKDEVASSYSSIFPLHRTSA